MCQNKVLNLITYGCQMNKYDSETIAGILQDYSLSDELTEADVVLINTCAVRQHAEDKVYSLLGRLSKIKDIKPDFKIGVCGCVAQQQGNNLIRKFPSVDLVIGPDNLNRLPDLLDKVYKGEKIVLTEHQPLPDDTLPSKRMNKIKAYVPITIGCNNRCTYCVVPYTRGNLRSRPAYQIIDEIKKLVESGYQEITVLGQNVNDYGIDFRETKLNFRELLIMISNINSLKRIRFITSHPKNFNYELINTIPQLKNVCAYIHLPIQSGSDKILKLMNRGYSLKFYQQLVEYLREKVPEVSLTTDLIVGFPGEEEEDFEKTLKAVEEIKFDSAFTFKYSPRPNTESASFPNQIPEEIKQKRLEKLIELTSKITKQKNQQLVGKTTEILIEGKNPQDPSFLMGRTKTDKVVFIPSNGKSLMGEFVNVKLIRCGTFSFKGELINS
ncbi:MAG: tRNA (N6-isopentenyl adenosine(37)-C2)-methylthiotransferase MiaB [bacterium]